MRLSDIGHGDTPVPAEIEAELDALDAALRGEELPAGMEGMEALVSDLRAERAAPDSEFGDALDRWAAAGFPRGRRPGLSQKATASDAGGRFRLFLASLTPRRLAYAGGAAATLIVLVVGVSQIDFQSMDTDDAGTADSGGGVATSAAEKPAEAEFGVATEDAGAPAVTNEEAARTFKDTRRELRHLTPMVAPALDSGSSAAGGQDTRKVERDAQMTLAAPADEVQDVTNEAIDVVDRNRGTVLSSQSSGTEDSARATLDLLIPTRTLDATIDELSDLADVKSLSEGTLDITRPFLDAKDRLAGLRAERKSLIAQIRVADTEEELDTLKLRLDAVHRAIADANAEFENIQARAQKSSVTLQITSEGAGEGDWSFEDALDDAGRVLTVGAGIALITAAVLLPIALIAAIAYFVLSAAKRRARERALDE